MSSDVDSAEENEMFLFAVDWICTYFSMMLIVLGCVCNPLSFIVLSRKSFRSSTMSVYLRILALSDMGVILNGLIPYVTIRVFDTDLRTNDISCSVSVFVYFLLLYTSSWTLVIVTTERVVSIIWPHRVHILCSRSASTIGLTLASFWLIFGILSWICTLVHRDLTIWDKMSNSSVIMNCVTVYDNTLTLPLSIVDAIIFAFLPSLILMIFNVIIVHGVSKSRRKIESQRNVTNLAGNTAIITENRTLPSFKTFRDKDMKRNKSSLKQKRTNRETSLTLTLVTISSTFILCNCPACAWGFWPSNQTEGGVGKLELAITNLLIVLMYTNNCLNFALYCANGSKFRTEFRAIAMEAAAGWCKYSKRLRSHVGEK